MQGAEWRDCIAKTPAILKHTLREASAESRTSQNEQLEPRTQAPASFGTFLTFCIFPLTGLVKKRDFAMKTLGISHLTDSTLVRMAQAGRLEAYDVLAVRVRSTLSALCRSWLGSRDQAEDAVQDTLIQGFLSISSLSDPERFRSWIVVIARRRCQLLRSREPRDHEPLTEALEEAIRSRSRALHPCPSQGAEERAEAQALWNCLMSLPEDLRLPLALQIEDDLSLSEIAEVLSLPLSTVKWRMHEARRRLKEIHTP